MCVHRGDHRTEAICHECEAENAVVAMPQVWDGDDA